jgi:hypothetical protein
VSILINANAIVAYFLSGSLLFNKSKCVQKKNRQRANQSIKNDGNHKLQSQRIYSRKKKKAKKKTKSMLF